MSATTEESRNWLDLPTDVTAKILLKLGAVEIIESAQKVCISWRRICKEPSMWRHIDMWNLGDLHNMEYDLEKMCRHAIDRSEGNLIDINIEHFGTDELLQYITERTSGLKRLRVFQCYGISDEGLIEAAPNFPLLEELEFTLCHLSGEALKAIGKSCPLLRCFKYNHKMSPFDYTECNEEALAIAENMPGLRELQLVGNDMTDTGLQAILNGCLQLESLDLRQCTRLGNVKKMCANQVKSLKLPDAPMDSYPFFLGFADCVCSDTEAFDDDDDDEFEYGYPFDDDDDDDSSDFDEFHIRSCDPIYYGFDGLALL